MAENETSSEMGVGSEFPIASDDSIFMKLTGIKSYTCVYASHGFLSTFGRNLLLKIVVACHCIAKTFCRMSHCC